MQPIEAHTCDLDTLRQALPIPYVMERYGEFPAEQTNGRLHYISPFRPDTSPSLDVFHHDRLGQRWGDYAEGSQGGVIDLIQRFEKCSDGEAIFTAREQLEEFLRLDPPWAGPTVEARERKPFDADHWLELLANGRSPYDWEHYHSLTSARPGLADAAIGQAGVVIHPQWPNALLFPYFTTEGELVGVKIRWADGGKTSAPGSKPALYFPAPEVGTERDRPVFLCEGETDTLAAWGQLGQDYLVAGIPGAGTLPDRIDTNVLTKRKVYLCFDPDSAGLTGLQRWRARLLELGCEVFVVLPPVGTDVAKMQPERIKELPQRVRVFTQPPPTLQRQGDVYGSVDSRGNVRVVSNWSFDVEMVLRGDDDALAYRGILRPHGKQMVITAEDLTGTGAIIRWGKNEGATWTGSSADVQQLAGLLRHESTLLPEGRMASRAGLHDGDYVWPDGHLGEQPWVYVPPANAIGLRDRIRLEPELVDPIDVVGALLELHRPDIMTPLLAWCAAAPLRPLFDQFPILSISGGSGSGKTTLTELVLDVFNGSRISTNLTSTTPYAVSSFFTSANAFPICFDEYRPGAREDSKAQLDQLIRDCYTGQVSAKGGMTDNKAQVTELRTDAPIVVSGEDSFIETSHTDRMVLIRLTKKGRGSLARIRQTPSRGFALEYLRWLCSPDRFGDIITHGLPPIDVKQTEGLNDRQCVNMAVLEFGWGLLNSFLSDYDPSFELPPLDLSLVTSEAVEAAASNPLIDAIRWAYGTEFGDRIVVVDGADDRIHVSPENLLQELRRAGIFTLPGSNTKSVRALLIDQHGGWPSKLRHPVSGKQIRTICLLKDVVGLEGDAE